MPQVGGRDLEDLNRALDAPPHTYRHWNLAAATDELERGVRNGAEVAGAELGEIDEAVLALLRLDTFADQGDQGATRACKTFDWDAMDRLYERSLISDPIPRIRHLLGTILSLLAGTIKAMDAEGGEKRAARTGTGPAPRKRLALFVLGLATFIALADTTIAGIALPSMRRELGFSGADAQWILNGYALAFGGLLMLLGRAGDLWGRRRVFVAGLVVFALASLLGGLSWAPWVLVAARFLQGVGAAAFVPASLSLLAATFAQGEERNRAFGVYGAMGALGFVVGMVGGGVITEFLGWRWVMFVNVPFALAALLPAPAAVPESRDEGAPRALDLVGALTITSGLASLVYAVSEVPEGGPLSPAPLGFGALGAVLLVLFVAAERRSSAPLVPLRVFGERAVVAPNAAIFLQSMVGIAWLYALTLHFQEVLGHGPLAAGLLFLPMTLAVVAAAPAAGRLATSFGLRATATSGLILVAAGLLLMARMSEDWGPPPRHPWHGRRGGRVHDLHHPFGDRGQRGRGRRRTGAGGGPPEHFYAAGQRRGPRRGRHGGRGLVRGRCGGFWIARHRAAVGAAGLRGLRRRGPADRPVGSVEGGTVGRAGGSRGRVRGMRGPRRSRPGAPARRRDRLPAVRSGRAWAVPDGLLGVGQPAQRRQPGEGRGGRPDPLRARTETRAPPHPTTPAPRTRGRYPDLSPAERRPATRRVSRPLKACRSSTPRSASASSSTPSTTPSARARSSRPAFVGTTIRARRSLGSGRRSTRPSSSSASTATTIVDLSSLAARASASCVRAAPSTAARSAAMSTV